MKRLDGCSIFYKFYIFINLKLVNSSFVLTDIVFLNSFYFICILSFIFQFVFISCLGFVLLLSNSLIFFLPQLNTILRSSVLPDLRLISILELWYYYFTLLHLLIPPTPLLTLCFQYKFLNILFKSIHRFSHIFLFKL
jgi:hypothetical protein